MLSAIRRNASGWVVRTLLIILIAGFGLWGIQGFQLGQETTAASVAGTKITAAQLSASFSGALQEQQQDRGAAYTRQDALDDGLARQVLRELITDQLYRQHAQDLGIRASNAMVNDAIRAGVTDEQGEFNLAQYRNELVTRGRTLKQQEEAVRDNMVTRQLFVTLAFAVTPPDVMARSIVRFMIEERDMDYALLPLDTVPEPHDPEDAQLQEYVDANPAQFIKPEYRSLSFLRIGLEDIRSAVEITEEEIQAAYDEKRFPLGSPGKRSLVELEVADQAAGEALLAGLDSTTLAELAKQRDLAESQYVLTDKSETELGYLGNDAVQALFAAGSGDFVGPLNTALGWRVYQVTAVAGAVNPTFEEAKEQIREYLIADKGRDVIYERSNKLQDDVASGMRLEEIAEADGLRLVQVTGVTREGLDQNGSLVENMPLSKKFFDEAFSMVDGSDPKVDLTESGEAFAVRLDSIKPAGVPDLAEIKPEARIAWLKQERMKLVGEVANGLVARINGGENEADVLQEAGLVTQTVSGLRRDGRSAPTSFTGTALARGFAAPLNKATAAPAADLQGYLILLPRSSKQGDVETVQAQIQTLKSQLQNAVANDVLDAYARYLEDDLGVDINQAVVDRAVETASPSAFR